MSELTLKVCTELVQRLQDLEKRAQHDEVYYKGAREAVVLVAAEVQRLTEELSGRHDRQSAAQGRPSGKQSSLSEVRKERAKRQKADHQAEQA